MAAACVTTLMTFLKTEARAGALRAFQSPRERPQPSSSRSIKTASPPPIMFFRHRSNADRDVVLWKNMSTLWSNSPVKGYRDFTVLRPLFNRSIIFARSESESVVPSHKQVGHGKLKGLGSGNWLNTPPGVI